MNVIFGIVIFVGMLKFIRSIGYSILKWISDYISSDSIDHEDMIKVNMVTANSMLIFAIVEIIVAFVALLAFIYSFSNLSIFRRLLWLE